MPQQAGNATLALLIGIVGAFAAKSHWTSLSQKNQEAGLRRQNIETDNQSLTALNIYKGLLSSNGENGFAIYPEPYLSLNPQLVQQKSKLAKQYSFQSSNATVEIELPVPRSFEASDLQKLMTQQFNLDSICGKNSCTKSSVRLLRYNRDLENAFPERIVSADVEVKTPVYDEQSKQLTTRTYIAQVPIESPKVTFATLKVTEKRPNKTALTHVADSKTPSKKVKVENPELEAELIVAGVALRGSISLFTNGIQESIQASDPPCKSGQICFPKHSANTIKNTNGVTITKLSNIKVKNGNNYKIMASIESLSEEQGEIELELQLNVNIPPPPNPPDPWICEYKCKDYTKWYYGEFINTKGAYWNMIPGKFSCMYNSTGNWSTKAAHPVYSFDPANNCKMEGPVGHRNSKTGCFTGDTLIQMADGSQQKISELKAGDLVWNPVARRSFPIRNIVVGKEEGEIINIHMPDGNIIKATGDHPFIGSDGRLVPANRLTVLINKEHRQIPVVTSPELNHSGVTVWNIELDASSRHSEHFIVANGAIAGDLYLQKYLNESDDFIHASEQVFKSLTELSFDLSELQMR